jgi:hypothetical protein
MINLSFGGPFSSAMQATSELEICKLSLVNTHVCTCKNRFKKFFRTINSCVIAKITVCNVGYSVFLCYNPKFLPA